MRIVKILMIAVAAAVAIGALATGLLSYRRSAAAREYEAQGFQMVEGCNGGAAVQADGQVLMIKQYLDDLTYPPVKDTKMVAQLQSALVVAQEKARVLGEDCRRRGHRETFPWKTNWVTIKQALTDFQKSNQ
jgi:hypothetical protein